ncbi:hypothetical protein DFJ74DRAFT_666414 [Hyaloraphidium curvatum]|nr:hypothetical protein DFJ74DRAFT_666414 [Hyaloraphidium curvatum]
MATTSNSPDASSLASELESRLDLATPVEPKEPGRPGATATEAGRALAVALNDAAETVLGTSELADDSEAVPEYVRKTRKILAMLRRQTKEGAEYAEAMKARPEASASVDERVGWAARALRALRGLLGPIELDLHLASARYDPDKKRLHLRVFVDNLSAWSPALGVAGPLGVDAVVTTGVGALSNALRNLASGYSPLMTLTAFILHGLDLCMPGSFSTIEYAPAPERGGANARRRRASNVVVFAALVTPRRRASREPPAVVGAVPAGAPADALRDFQFAVGGGALLSADEKASGGVDDLPP